MFLGFDGYAGKETTDVTSDHDAWGVDIESRRRAFHLSSVAPRPFLSSTTIQRP